MTIERNQIYTLKEAADALRVSRQTLYNHIGKGDLRIPKLGKEYRISGEQLQYILASGFGRNRNK